MTPKSHLLQTPHALKQQNGFTLLEVLVSLVLLAIVCTTVLQITSHTQKDIALTTQKNTANLLLKKAYYLVWKDGFSQFIEKQESFSDQPSYSWRAFVTDTDEPQISLLTIEIFLEEGHPLASMETFIWEK